MSDAGADAPEPASRRSAFRRSLAAGVVLTAGISPLWFVTTGGLPLAAMLLQPWSTAILFNGMAPAWDPDADGVPYELAWAATVSVVASVACYALLAALAQRAWKSASTVGARVVFAVGALAGYAALCVLCLVLVWYDWPTVPAPGAVEEWLRREFGIVSESPPRGARYAYYGIVDWSEFYRFALPPEPFEARLGAAGYTPVVPETLRLETRIQYEESLEEGPYWWQPGDGARPYEKTEGRTDSLLLLDEDRGWVFLRRDNF